MVLQSAGFATRALLLACLLSESIGDEAQKDPVINYSALEKPFRMQKCNILWEKSRAKLTESKLRLLYFELKVQDKEEIALKKLMSEGGDKEGAREADLRKKFNGIINVYGLSADSDSTVDRKTIDKTLKRVFKDKKLDRLWEKALSTGMDEEEMMLLKKEFQDHQEKIDQHNRLKEISRNDRNSNNIHTDYDYDDDDGPPGMESANEFDEKLTKELRDGYAKLHRNAVDGLHREFEEPKVNGMWKLAQEADFNEEELNSIKDELKHFEHRLKKLHHLKSERDVMDHRHEEMFNEVEKIDLRKKMGLKLRKYEKDLKEMHRSLADQIASRHSEL